LFERIGNYFNEPYYRDWFVHYRNFRINVMYISLWYMCRDSANYDFNLVAQLPIDKTYNDSLMCYEFQDKLYIPISGGHYIELGKGTAYALWSVANV